MNAVNSRSGPRAAQLPAEGALSTGLGPLPRHLSAALRRAGPRSMWSAGRSAASSRTVCAMITPAGFPLSAPIVSG
eukprot:6703399-Heterocapsa_arctica.AAC.1